MSKAFTSEETEDAGPLLRAAPTLAPGEVRYISAAGHAALVAERTRLEEERLSLGRSGEVDAKTRRAEVEARLSLLEKTLAVLTVAPPPPQPDRVYFGAIVAVEDEAGSQTEYRIVGPDEVDVRAGKISVDSPLARALLGRAEGDVTEVRRPRGVAELTIVTIRYDS